MCGIAGFVDLSGRVLVEQRDAELLHQMAGQIAHRGPDDEQIHLWTNVGLAFRRLSIVDIDGGRQPLFNEDQTILVICNGEIYNHRHLRARFGKDHVFRSRSDCEIIPHLYEEMGMAQLEHLNGIFAFALLDKTRKKLLLCRDRLGVKPLYYHHDRDILVFGSEIKAILRHPSVPKHFDWHAALTFRTAMYYPHDTHKLTSFFEGIHHLAAGRFLEIDLVSGEIDERCYWDPAPASNQRAEVTVDRNAFVRQYGELLDEAVRLQLMADVPCGIFLSGGIDSVAVAGFASQRRPLHTFSVLSQSTLTNGDAPSAHSAAKSFQLPNHMVFFDWRKLEISPSLWRTILWKVETPIAGAEQFYKYLLHAYARTRVPGLKVMLLGSGSDEFNGGYTKTVFNSSVEPSWDKFEQFLRAYELESLLQLTGGWNPYSKLGMPGHSIISEDYLADLARAQHYEVPWYGYRDMYRRLLQMYQLWHEDRTSAANGVEARVPFLDHRLVELTYQVPKKLHRDLFWDKTILREALKGSVPDDLCRRPKTPFFVGEDLRYTRRLMYNMLCANNNALVQESIEEAEGSAGVVDRDAFWKVFRALPDDPEYANVDLVMDLVNMGLLATMAKSPPNPENSIGELPVSEVSIDDWPDWEKRFNVSLVQRSEGPDRNTVIRFADGIRIVKSELGDPRFGDMGDYHILKNNTLEFTLEQNLEPWLKFLKFVDGARTVGEILKAADLSEIAVWKHLEEAIEYNVLQVNSN